MIIFCSAAFLVPTRDGKLSAQNAENYVIYEKLTPTERLNLCKGGFELVQKNPVGKTIEFRENCDTADLKKYVLEEGKKSWTAPFKILSAFKCPTKPDTYIHIAKYDEVNKSMLLWVIFKDKDPLPGLEEIIGYQIWQVENISEGKL